MISILGVQLTSENVIFIAVGISVLLLAIVLVIPGVIRFTKKNSRGNL